MTIGIKYLKKSINSF